MNETTALRDVRPRNWIAAFGFAFAITMMSAGCAPGPTTPEEVVEATSALVMPTCSVPLPTYPNLATNCVMPDDLNIARYPGTSQPCEHMYLSSPPNQGACSDPANPSWVWVFSCTECRSNVGNVAWTPSLVGLWMSKSRDWPIPTDAYLATHLSKYSAEGHCTGTGPCNADFVWFTEYFYLNLYHGERTYTLDQQVTTLAVRNGAVVSRALTYPPTSAGTWSEGANNAITLTKTGGVPTTYRYSMGEIFLNFYDAAGNFVPGKGWYR